VNKLPALTIKARIIMASTIVFGIALIGFATVIYHSSKRAEYAKLEVRLESHAEKLQTEIEEQVPEGVFPNLEDLNAIRTEGLLHVLRQLSDSKGQVVLTDSILSKEPTLTAITRTVRVPAFELLNIGGHSYLGYWIPVEVEEQNRFVLLVAVSLNEVDESLSGMRLMFYLVIPATLLLVALAIFLITRRALLPLDSMTKTARQITASNLDQRLDLPYTRDEVRTFAETFNGMIERINAAFQSQRQFVADASHEIRTPLTIVTSELEQALTYKPRPEVKAGIETSLSEIDRLARMTEGLLILARIDASRIGHEQSSYRLDELLVEVVQSLHRLAEVKEVSLSLYIEDAVEMIGYGATVRRAVMNVVDNAVKYTLANTEVSVRLETSSSSGVLIKVVDHGPGITETDQKRVFERFFRGENARANIEGSGLGLAIAKALIESQHGSLSLESTVGQGTTVTIVFPNRSSL
jgi:heavy metal sensor kinase